MVKFIAISNLSGQKFCIIDYEAAGVYGETNECFFNGDKTSIPIALVHSPPKDKKVENILLHRDLLTIGSVSR